METTAMALNQGANTLPTADQNISPGADLGSIVRDAVKRGFDAIFTGTGFGEEPPDEALETVSSEVERALIPFVTGAIPVTGIRTSTNNPDNQAISALNRTDAPADQIGTGPGDFLRHPDTGHIIGVEQAPPSVITGAPTHDEDGNPSQYPKWVVPDASWVQQDTTGRPMAPMLGEPHVDRAGNLTVLVQSKEEEERAMGAADKKDPNAVAPYSPTTSNPGGGGIGGADPTGGKTLYPTETVDAKNADPVGDADLAAKLNNDATGDPAKPITQSATQPPMMPNSLGHAVGNTNPAPGEFNPNADLSGGEPVDEDDAAFEESERKAIDAEEERVMREHDARQAAREKNRKK